MKYTISIISENGLGLLYRVADLFLRKRINIRSLLVTEKQSNSHFKIDIDCDKETVSKLVNQIGRIVEVKKVGYVRRKA